MQCPSVVYGVGLSKRMAIDAARVYANARGTGCGQYSGHCQVKKFIKWTADDPAFIYIYF